MTSFRKQTLWWFGGLVVVIGVTVLIGLSLFSKPASVAAVAVVRGTATVQKSGPVAAKTVGAEAAALGGVTENAPAQAQATVTPDPSAALAGPVTPTLDPALAVSNPTATLAVNSSPNPAVVASATSAPNLNPASQPTATYTRPVATATRTPVNPGPTPTAKVTATVQPTVAVPQNGFSFTYLSSPVSVGAYASVIINTTSGKDCSISYTAPGGSSPLNLTGVGARKADGHGVCSWAWQIPTDSATGNASITITANGMTQTYTMTIH